ncbi:AI-2E family transporter [Haloarchaeobius sp. HRN-SO-5]|uniref:AI-2E family transporter n=1 Tax=Haloarchaeobius sp. HRN-SO-5 TaxID=3446118 RepID=UPI003EB8808C
MLGGFDIRESRAAWWILAIALGTILTWVFYSFVGTFVFGIFIYYATRPVYQQMQQQGIRPPSLAASIAIFTLALPFLLLLAYTVAIGLQELNTIITNIQDQQTSNGQTISQIESVIQPYVDVSDTLQNPEQLLSNPDDLSIVTDLANEAQGYAGFVGTALLHLFVMIALAFYMLRDGPQLSHWFQSTFGDERGVLAAFLRAVDRDFKNIFFGNILNAFLTAIIGALSYSVLNAYAPPGMGIPYAVLVGLLAGAASLIPVVGMKLVYFPVGGVLFYRAFTSDQSGLLWFPVVFVVVSFVIVDVIPDLVLRPYVSGRNLHVGSVMFAYIFGPLLFGWYGIFLGPMLLVLSVHFARLVLPELLHSEKVQPYAVDPSYFEDETVRSGVSAGDRDRSSVPDERDAESTDDAPS